MTEQKIYKNVGEILQDLEDGDELTVYDKDYDTEFYLYKTTEKDDWDKALDIVASKLKVVDGFSRRELTVTADMSGLLEKSMDNLKKADLFNYYDVDYIMDSINQIMSGEVSESWMLRFANALTND